MLSLHVATVLAAHPTLPTSWTSYVQEISLGNVLESEHFVDKPTAANPSAKWTNFTDGSCQRLIYQTSGYDTTRYLYKCDSVSCCHEDDTSGPIEYQIPNVHPTALAPVHSLGKRTITLFDGQDYEADAWTWKFTAQNFTAFTQETDSGTVLLRWHTAVFGQSFDNDYVNYKAVAEADLPAFLASFHPPSDCRVSCNDLHKKGQLSDSRIAFLRAEQPMQRPMKQPTKQPMMQPTFLEYVKEKSPLDTCTGGHQFCCPAPQGDCNNCPDSAKTGDCCAKGSCCCA
uniref:Uncharacterized protein n=1 Tax=Coccolithus braarudii TaxID=221442 RepID=A0A7S0KYT9_9EUKA